MIKRVNKKGQDLSIGTLILIVLGIVVLVLLVLGFSMGWNNLWEKINIFGGGSSIGDVATACSLAVTQENQYGYCQDFKKVKVDGKTEYLNCEDGRISSSLTTKLACTKPEGYNTWKEWYCGEKLTTDERTKQVKVNNAICPAIGECEGTVKGCNQIISNTECSAQLRCSWNQAESKCAGTATSCNSLTQAQCGENAGTGQQGCSWKAAS